MGEGVFPNMAEQAVGHGFSHPAQLNGQEIGTHTASSPAGSAALPCPGKAAERPDTACPTAHPAQTQDGHHLCTWAGSALSLCLSSQPLEQPVMEHGRWDFHLLPAAAPWRARLEDTQPTTMGCRQPAAHRDLAQLLPGKKA